MLATFKTVSAGAVLLLAVGQGPLRVETVFVQADVYVSSAQGTPIDELSVEDFELYEDGVRKTIETFRSVRIPLPGGSGFGYTSAPPSRTAADPVQQGRTYVIVLDDLHIAPIYTGRVKTAINQFLERGMGPHDFAALAYSSGPRQEFTSDKAALTAAVANFSGQKLRSAVIEKLQDPRVNSSGRAPRNADPFEPERAHRAQTTFNLLVQLGQRFPPDDGRRVAMLFVSEGVEVDEPGGRSGADVWSANRELNRALAALNRANVVVYPIDPRGIGTGAEGLIQSSTIFETQGLGVSGKRREIERAQDLLHAIAANTGGAFLAWRPDMASDIARIVRESSQYYILGYSAPPLPARPTFRRIEVRVKKAGARVAARNGYLASP